MCFSSRECQIEDWPVHRTSCQLHPLQPTVAEKGVTFDETIDTDCCVLKSVHALQISTASKSRPRPIVSDAVTSYDNVHTDCNASDNDVISTTCVDKGHSKCVREVSPKAENSEAIIIRSVKNLDVHCAIQAIKSEEQIVAPRCNNASDVPQGSGPFQITVRCGSDSFLIPLQRSWSSEEMFHEILSAVKIVPEKLRLISSGKQITAENLLWAVDQSKPVFLAIGEKAESEDGLDAEDIAVVMKQLAVERNVAVRALRQTGDVVDAILFIANK